jgi:RNA polymerase sigma-70 factor, ECF subfamily
VIKLRSSPPTPSPSLRADDASTVAALRAGDERTFNQLFARKYAMMKRVARGYVPDAIAEEIVQDTWLAVLGGIDRFKARSSLDTWIFSILINQARKRGQREQRAVPLSSLGSSGGDEPSVDPDRFQRSHGAWPGHWSAPPRPWQQPERRLQSLEAREQLKRAIAQLPERQRLVVGLRDVEGRSPEEVCELLDVTPDNQRVLLHRGRSRLRNVLEDYIQREDV